MLAGEQCYTENSSETVQIMQKGLLHKSLNMGGGASCHFLVSAEVMSNLFLSNMYLYVGLRILVLTKILLPKLHICAQ